MTPPKVNGQSEAFYNYAEGVCQAPEQVSQAGEASGPVCSAAASSPVRLLNVDLSTRFASLQRNHVLSRQGIDSKQITAAAAQGTGGETSSSAELLGTVALGILNIFNPLNLVGCGNSGDLQEAPPDVPVLPPKEVPDPIPGEHDGVGSVESSFGSGDCIDPAAMFANYSDNNLLMVCADSEGAGANLIELVDPQSGAVTSISVPKFIENDPSRPVSLSAGAAHEATKLIFAGLRPNIAEADFVDNLFPYRNTGIYTLTTSSGENGKWTPFKPLTEIGEDGKAGRIPLIDPATGDAVSPQGGEFYTTVSLDPNTPVSMAVDGDTLYVLNMNFDKDQNGNGTKLLAPASIHAFGIAQDGLSEQAFGSQRLQVLGVESVGPAMILDGYYAPTAIASVGDGRLAVLIRGVPHSDNSSTLLLLNIEGPTNQREIPLSDSAELNMWAAASNQLPIVTLGDVNYALVGAGDESGRVAMVNLDAAEGESAVKYVGVFGPGHNVVSIVVDAAAGQAIAVSEQGQAVSINLKEIDSLSGLPKVGKKHDLPADARVAALRGNSLVVAHPTLYSQVTVTPAPVSP